MALTRSESHALNEEVTSLKITLGRPEIKRQVIVCMNVGMRI